MVLRVKNHWAPTYSYGPEGQKSLGSDLQPWSRGSKITGPRATAMVLRVKNHWGPEGQNSLGSDLQLWSRGSKTTGLRPTAMVPRVKNHWAPTYSHGPEGKKSLGSDLQPWSRCMAVGRSPVFFGPQNHSCRSEPSDF